jgi:hypothetical protein
MDAAINGRMTESKKSWDKPHVWAITSLKLCLITISPIKVDECECLILPIFAFARMWPRVRSGNEGCLTTSLPSIPIDDELLHLATQRHYLKTEAAAALDAELRRRNLTESTGLNISDSSNGKSFPEYKSLERVKVSDPWFEVYKPSS